MKKLILLASFILGSVLMVNAQPAKKSPEQRAEHLTKSLSKKLALNPGQSKQVYAAFLMQATRIDSLRSNQSEDKRLNRLTARTIMLTTRQHVMALLNDTQKQQYTEWEKMVKERHESKKDSTGAIGAQ